MYKNGTIIQLEKHFDSSGALVVVERLNEKLGFDIKRVYYIYDTNVSFVRGKHAHKSLKQLLVCVHGKCTIRLDNGHGIVEDIELSSPDKGLVIGANIWREMYAFSKDCVLLVMASEYYNEDDYIRDYDVFVKYVNK